MAPQSSYPGREAESCTPAYRLIRPVNSAFHRAANPGGDAIPFWESRPLPSVNGWRYDGEEFVIAFHETLTPRNVSQRPLLLHFGHSGGGFHSLDTLPCNWRAAAEGARGVHAFVESFAPGRLARGHFISRPPRHRDAPQVRRRDSRGGSDRWVGPRTAVHPVHRCGCPHNIDDTLAFQTSVGRAGRVGHSIRHLRSRCPSTSRRAGGRHA